MKDYESTYETMEIYDKLVAIEDHLESISHMLVEACRGGNLSPADKVEPPAFKIGEDISEEKLEEDVIAKIFGN